MEAEKDYLLKVVATDGSGKGSNANGSLKSVVRCFTNRYVAGKEVLCRKVRSKPMFFTVVLAMVLIILVLSVGSAMAQNTKTVTKLFLDSTSNGITYFFDGASYSYDEQGINTASHYSMYIEPIYNRSTYYYTYNDKGQVVDRINYLSNGKIAYKTEFIYNDEGYLIEEIESINNCPTSNKPDCELTPKYRYTYTYDNEGKRIGRNYDVYINKTFNTYNKWEYIYDVKENMIEEICYAMRADGSGEWRNSERYTYIYDSVGNVIEVSPRYIWSSSKNEWQQEGRSALKYEYTYLLETDKVVPNFVKDGDYIYKGIVSTVTTTNAGPTTKKGTTTYYWSARDVEVKDNGDETGIAETDDNESLQVYPNPTTGQLTIESAELKIERVEILDVLGQCVFTTPNPSKGGESSTSAQFPSFGGAGVVIDVSHLAAGMYFLKIDNKVVKFAKE